MRKQLCLYIVYILSLFPLLCSAQVYKYIGVEEGLSNRQVYAIQKDHKGYMWFLTHSGIDRYNGKEFKRYKLTDGNKKITSMINLNWLYVDNQGDLWEIGKRGRIFRYDAECDSFKLVHKLPEEEIKDQATPISYGYVDNNGKIWLCQDKVIYLYDIKSGKSTIIPNETGERITDIEQAGAKRFFISTETGLFSAEMKENALALHPCKQWEDTDARINRLHYHPATRQLFIGTFRRGMYVYQADKDNMTHIKSELTDVSINCIKNFNKDEILIATDGIGVYKMNTKTHESVPYIVADYNRYNAMNGNTIYDIYVDDEQRIWMANYPIGITVRNERYADYRWIKHSVGNDQSLVNNQVNAIIEDSEGDLWYATNNGISLYLSKSRQWHSFLDKVPASNHNKNRIFISLCEVAPGIIWAGGYSSGIFQINKKQMTVDSFSPSLMSNVNIQPDKYIRAIVKDSSGDVWSGGYYNLKRINYHDKSIRPYSGLSSITSIIEKDSTSLWIGTATGLYLLDKESGKYECIQLPIESFYINTLYQAPDKTLYIGTNNAGMLVYDNTRESFKHYHTDNCALISNNVCAILYDGNRDLFLSTEYGLTTFNPVEETFVNWTKEQGLRTDHFNPVSGTLRKNGNFVFGSIDGAVEFNKNMELPRDHKFKMIFSDLRIFYQNVYPNRKGSPLQCEIDKTEELRLTYDQNIFSLHVSEINYDYPSLILYSWKLEGFYDGWSQPGHENIIRFTNISPGEYTLRVRAVSSEDPRVILEERSMKIIIEQPFWLSIWALLLYALIAFIIAGSALRIIILRRQRKVSDEKIRFFVNTAHDIRTPLTLIKAPLEDIHINEPLTPDGHTNLSTALRNVNALLRLTTNLINFERADNYSGALYVSEYELGGYLEELVGTFHSYANVKHINLTYESNFRYMNVWMDKEKMESILKNIISNSLKYTPEGGSVHVFATESGDTWSIEVKDSGIGIPASEQKKLFKVHFRGSNAINSKVTGSGIGLLLVARLVRLHKGKLSFSSVEGEGTYIKITFPKKSRYFRKKMQRADAKQQKKKATPKINIPVTGISPSSGNIYEKTEPRLLDADEHAAKILIVEDNDELKEYLRNTLSGQYRVQACTNGEMALIIVKEYQPDLIISDVMMPGMRGDELCHTLKNDIETSHIPIILLTALNTEENVIDGLQSGADEYIVKPFNIGILRANIATLLTNRELLRRKYATLALSSTPDKAEPANVNCSNDLEWKFIADTKKHIEDNLSNQEFNVDTLSSLMYMSRSSFYNKLRTLTGQAPADYIRTIRLNRAAQLLKEQTYTITEIAEMTGFNDAKYFREVFKKRFNMSPTQYAKGEEEKE